MENLTRRTILTLRNGRGQRYLQWRSLTTLDAAASDAHDDPFTSRDPGESSKPQLFYRSMTARIREGNKRATRDIRKEGIRIPCLLEGRGKLKSMLLQTEMAPLFKDMRDGRFALQKLGKTKFTGPLYELRLEEGTLDEHGKPLQTPDFPFERIRVLPTNLEIHPLTEHPLSLTLRYSPEGEPVRVRVPIHSINEEKCEDLRDAGWLNRFHWYVDINVAPHVKAPLFATLDVAGMKMKDKGLIGDLDFEGKGQGCKTVLPDDTPAAMISSV